MYMYVLISYELYYMPNLQNVYHLLFFFEKLEIIRGDHSPSPFK